MNFKTEDVKPVNGTIFLLDDPKQEVTKGGIILADTAEGDRMHIGTVLAVSPFLLEDGTYKDPPMVPGHRVLYGQHAGAGCIWVDELDKRTYRMVKWNEILAIVK